MSSVSFMHASELQLPLPQDKADLALSVHELHRWLSDRQALLSARQELVDGAGESVLSVAMLEEAKELRALRKSLRQLCSYVMGDNLPVSSLEERLQRGEALEGAVGLIAEVSTQDQVLAILNGD